MQHVGTCTVQNWHIRGGQHSTDWVPPECANFDWQICVQVVLEFTLVAGGAKWEMGYG